MELDPADRTTQDYEGPEMNSQVWCHNPKLKSQNGRARTHDL